MRCATIIDIWHHDARPLVQRPMDARQAWTAAGLSYAPWRIGAGSGCDALGAAALDRVEAGADGTEFGEDVVADLIDAFDDVLGADAALGDVVHGLAPLFGVGEFAPARFGALAAGGGVVGLRGVAHGRSLPGVDRAVTLRVARCLPGCLLRGRHREN